MVLEERFLHSPVFDNRLKPFDVLFHVRFVRNPYRLLIVLELPLIVLLHIREVCSSTFPLSSLFRTLPHRREGQVVPLEWPAGS